MSVTLPVVSGIAAAILLFTQIVLMLNVVRARRRLGPSPSIEPASVLEISIRRHGNLAENAGLFVAGFSILEMLGAPKSQVVALCSAFILARLFHAVGFGSPTMGKLRFAGTALTAVTGFALAARLAIAAVATW